MSFQFHIVHFYKSAFSFSLKGRYTSRNVTLISVPNNNVDILLEKMKGSMGKGHLLFIFALTRGEIRGVGVWCGWEGGTPNKRKWEGLM